MVYLLLQISHSVCLVIRNCELSLQICNSDLKQRDISQTLLILELSLGQSALENLDFLIE